MVGFILLCPTIIIIACSLMKKQFGNKLYDYILFALPYLFHAYLLFSASCIVHIFMFNLYNLFLLQFIVFMVTVQLMNNFLLCQLPYYVTLVCQEAPFAFLTIRSQLYSHVLYFSATHFLQNSVLLIYKPNS